MSVKLLHYIRDINCFELTKIMIENFPIPRASAMIVHWKSKRLWGLMIFFFCKNLTLFLMQMHFEHQNICIIISYSFQIKISESLVEWWGADGIEWKRQSINHLNCVLERFIDFADRKSACSIEQ